MDDRELARRIRRELPPKAFQHGSKRALIAVPLIAGIVTLNFVLIAEPLRAFSALVSALALGNLYVSLFFFGHEAGHGAATRSRHLQSLLMYAGFWIFCLSPHLWRVWHNRVHHGYTNRAGYDPDNFGDVQSYVRFPATNFLLKVGPGSGHWLSLIYFPTWFTALAQGVLWIKSRRMAGFGQLNRVRAAIDSALMAASWAALGVRVGIWRSLLVIVLPMMTANAIAMAYISTNHLLRPQVEDYNVLDSSMSVTTYRLLDRLHFHFSHHVEHHLFPSMNTHYAPLVRSILRRLAGDRFLAPSHRQALMVLFRTPRVYDGVHALVDPQRELRVRFRDIDGALWRGDTLIPVERIGGATFLETIAS